jgi:type IV pilus assembly protein PilW
MRAFVSTPCRQRGLTLIELMISMAIGLVILVALSALFVSSSRSRREVELSADVIESGRYGVDVLSRHLSQAGFYGTLSVPAGTTVALCSTDPAVWANSLAIHAYGLNNGAADPTCLARKAGTDAIFIQRASTCTTSEAGLGCAEDASNAYLQVSECGTEYTATPFVVAVGNNAAPFVLQTKACDGTKAAKRKLIRRFYYVSPSDVLSYVDVTTAGVMPPVALVENIEQMQLEYGIDDGGDGTPDRFTPTPAAEDWPNVVGVRVWLLARSTNASSHTANAVTFQMSDTTVDIAAASANFKRRVYTGYIPFLTPKSRLES